MADPKPKKSITRAIEGKPSRNFSSFDDMAEHAVLHGRAKCLEAIRKEPSPLWGDLLFEWFTQGQIGCIFAVALAQNGESPNWYNVLMEETGWDADTVTAVVDDAANDGADAIQIIFPGRGDVDQAISIMAELLKSDRWLCADVWRLSEEPECNSHQLGLRWISPEKTYESWVLGIGDFPEQPFTRRFSGAPFIALVIRPTPPVEKRAPTKIGESGLPAAHLAHLDDTLGGNQNLRDRWTEATRTAKRHLIKPEPMSRARARVTFALSAEAYSKLAAQAPVRPYVEASEEAAST
ncbi:MAG: hypothetical protein KGJ03_00845 [Betaproteobacteria bacterium]|nr:hypothetical protein [Betaproteobacteria bacterium]MBU6511752.1 hypothetical protein [Betaproteobacteria bacterium]MDE1954245.1 hypothetical protein [Betaproteobacteria bacterium]MDE2153300.1 hypothetical protein [Betaproteobacteria bacterium]